MDEAVIEAPAKSRDAELTRQHLLASARLRFARDGYSGTTVRDIASDAGVNVALINRYFVSKEGLFEACLDSAVDDLDEEQPRPASFDQLVTRMVRGIAEAPNGEYSLKLLLLLRSSGDPGADEIRRRTLHEYASGMAELAGPNTARFSADELGLRAQLALATVIGVAVLRSPTGLEPLTSASQEALTEPLRDILTALLNPAA